MNALRRSVYTTTIVAVAGLALASVAHAQAPGANRSNESPSWWTGHGTMMGPGMMRREDWGRSCGPAAAGFGQWRLDRLDREIKLTDAQRARFEELKSASIKAAEQMRAACTPDLPATMPARMSAMEKRLDAMLQAVRTMLPPMNAFYETLTDDQKARLEGSRGQGRFWRWMHRW